MLVFQSIQKWNARDLALNIILLNLVQKTDILSFQSFISAFLLVSTVSHKNTFRLPLLYVRRYIITYCNPPLCADGGHWGGFSEIKYPTLLDLGSRKSDGF